MEDKGYYVKRSVLMVNGVQVASAIVIVMMHVTSKQGSALQHASVGGEETHVKMHV